MPPRAARVPRRKKGVEVFSDEEDEKPTIPSAVPSISSNTRWMSNAQPQTAVNPSLAHNKLAESLLSQIKTGLPPAMHAHLTIGDTETVEKIWKIVVLAGETDARVRGAASNVSDKREFALKAIGEAKGMADLGKVLLGSVQFVEIWKGFNAIFDDMLKA